MLTLRDAAQTSTVMADAPSPDRRRPRGPSVKDVVAGCDEVDPTGRDRDWSLSMCVSTRLYSASSAGQSQARTTGPGCIFMQPRGGVVPCSRLACTTFVLRCASRPLLYGVPPSRRYPLAGAFLHRSFRGRTFALPAPSQRPDVPSSWSLRPGPTPRSRPPAFQRQRGALPCWPLRVPLAGPEPQTSAFPTSVSASALVPRSRRPASARWASSSGGWRRQVEQYSRCGDKVSNGAIWA